MFDNSPDNLSVGTGEKRPNPAEMTNTEILQEIENMMNTPAEEMDTSGIEK